MNCIVQGITSAYDPETSRPLVLYRFIYDNGDTYYEVAIRDEYNRKWTPASIVQANELFKVLHKKHKHFDEAWDEFNNLISKISGGASGEVFTED